MKGHFGGDVHQAVLVACNDIDIRSGFFFVSHLQQM